MSARQVDWHAAHGACGSPTRACASACCEAETFWLGGVGDRHDHPVGAAELVIRSPRVYFREPLGRLPFRVIGRMTRGRCSEMREGTRHFGVIVDIEDVGQPMAIDRDRP